VSTTIDVPDESDSVEPPLPPAPPAPTVAVAPPAPPVAAALAAANGDDSELAEHEASPVATATSVRAAT